MGVFDQTSHQSRCFFFFLPRSDKRWPDAQKRATMCRRSASFVWRPPTNEHRTVPFSIYLSLHAAIVRRRHRHIRSPLPPLVVVLSFLTRTLYMTPSPTHFNLMNNKRLLTELRSTPFCWIKRRKRDKPLRPDRDWIGGGQERWLFSLLLCQSHVRRIPLPCYDSPLA